MSAICVTPARPRKTLFFRSWKLLSLLSEPHLSHSSQSVLSNRSWELKGLMAAVVVAAAVAAAAAAAAGTATLVRY